MFSDMHVEYKGNIPREGRHVTGATMYHNVRDESVQQAHRSVHRVYTNMQTLLQSKGHLPYSTIFYLLLDLFQITVFVFVSGFN